ncbi:MAG: hypothetical protein QF511_02865, partial [Rhodospirillales bacterium]|nr:hypothetical protein [Rhodospirillales bacterium]
MTAQAGITKHLLREGDARDLTFIPTESVHLICTSPPYGALKTYPDHPSQLGNIAAYEKFLEKIDTVWAECLRGWCRKVGGKLENWRKLLIVKHSERRFAAAKRSLRHGTSYSIDVAAS